MSWSSGHLLEVPLTKSCSTCSPPLLCRASRISAWIPCWRITRPTWRRWTRGTSRFLTWWTSLEGGLGGFSAMSVTSSVVPGSSSALDWTLFWSFDCFCVSTGHVHALSGHVSVWNLQDPCQGVHAVFPRSGKRLQGHSLWVQFSNFLVRTILNTCIVHHQTQGLLSNCPNLSLYIYLLIHQYQNVF